MLTSNYALNKHGRLRPLPSAPRSVKRSTFRVAKTEAGCVENASAADASDHGRLKSVLSRCWK